MVVMFHFVAIVVIANIANIANIVDVTNIVNIGDIATIVNIFNNTYLPTTAPASVLLRGTNFGPYNTYITASYGININTLDQYYNDLVCFVTVPHIEMNCSTAESKKGINRKYLRWQVNVEYQQSPLSTNNKTAYEIPEITGLDNHIDMITNGNETISLYGTNFGPSGGTINGYYGPTSNHRTYHSSKCTVLNHTNIECMSIESRSFINRYGFRWIVDIEDQTSIPSVNNKSQYAIPQIIALSDHIRMNTMGNEPIFLYGRNFGPISTLENKI